MKRVYLYMLTGFTFLYGIGEVAEHIHLDKLVDSSFPRHDFPCENPNDIHLRNYRNFVGICSLQLNI